MSEPAKRLDLNNDDALQRELSLLILRATEESVHDVPDLIHRLAQGPETQLRYERVLQALAFIRMQKVLGYGESRYKPESARYNLSLAYGDLERKMIRLKHQLFNGEPLTREVLAEQLMETGADLANYAVMFVELITILLEQELHE